MTTIALFGAAGKIGARIARLLNADPNYHTLFVEAGEGGEARLRANGLTPTPQPEAVKAADVVILAVPDLFIGKIAGEIVANLKSGALVIGLDPAAPHSGKLPPRADISYFITHPCHPPVYNDETSSEARMDYFGGIAKQNIVCSLMQGTGSALCPGRGDRPQDVRARHERASHHGRADGNSGTGDGRNRHDCLYANYPRSDG